MKGFKVKVHTAYAKRLAKVAAKPIKIGKFKVKGC